MIATIANQTIKRSLAGRIDNYLCELAAQPGGSQGRPDTTAGSKPISIIGRPTSDSPRTASLVSKSPAPVPNAANLTSFPSACKSSKRRLRKQCRGSSLNHARYDGENRLTKVDSGNTATYVYNENGERVRKVTPGGWTEYFYGPNGMVQSEYNGSSWPAQYVYAGGQLIAEYSNGTTEFAHSDHLGSTRLMTGMSRQVLDNLDYLPFGRQVTGGSTSTHKFTGLELDAETNQDHTPFRQYGPIQVRWTSPDPYMGSYDLTNPQSLNRYAYVGNNPLAFTDPSGLEMCLGCGMGPDGGSDCDIYGLFCGCDPIFGDCGGVPDGGGGGPDGPPPPPHFSGKYKNLDPDQVWTEQLGLPAGTQLNTGGILDIFGVDTGCEFGACGGGPMDATNGQQDDQLGQDDNQFSYSFVGPPWLPANRHAQGRNPGRPTPRPSPRPGGPGPPEVGPSNEPPASGIGRVGYYILQVLRIVSNQTGQIFVTITVDTQYVCSHTPIYQRPSYCRQPGG